MLSVPQIAGNLQICRNCRRSMGAVHSGVGIIPCPVDGETCLSHSQDGKCPENLLTAESAAAAAPPKATASAVTWGVAHGPRMWKLLHTAADADPRWLASFTANVPCGDCKRHWLEVLKELPPVFGDGWFSWTVEAHNRVNDLLGKARLTLEAAMALWQTPAANNQA